MYLSIDTDISEFSANAESDDTIITADIDTAMIFLKRVFISTFLSKYILFVIRIINKILLSRTAGITCPSESSPSYVVLRKFLSLPLFIIVKLIFLGFRYNECEKALKNTTAMRIIDIYK
jgi:hypothetical protein